MKRIETWKALVTLEDKFARSGEEWVFRGQSSRSHRMCSTLDRACQDFGARGRTIRVVEQAAFIDFKRSCHLYSPAVLPEDSDTLGWMALMRHYGAPSRLLDFTYSLFIAAYFAAEAEKSKPTVWAVNKTWLSRHMETHVLAIPRDRAGVDGAQLWDAWASREGWAVDRLLFQQPPLRLVAPIGPMRMNDRLLLQQGLFLASTDITVPFHDVLEQLPGSKGNVVKIGITSQKARFEVLDKLHRTGLKSRRVVPGAAGIHRIIAFEDPHYPQVGAPATNGSSHRPAGHRSVKPGTLCALYHGGA